MKDFFISYNQADRAWAEWIAWTLEEEGYSVIIQAWDFRPGSNFVLDMNQAIDEAETIIAVLSADYLKAEYPYPEWAAAFRQDPKSQKRTLIPIRVSDCQPTGLLGSITHVDLFDIGESEARMVLLDALKYRRKPEQKSRFPSEKVDFPGSAECPYRGLSTFQQQHAKFFFGRDKFSETLIESVKSQPFLAIIGNSGVGKSSLVFAGLIPKLKELGGWNFLSFRPIDDPFQELSKELISFLHPALNKRKFKISKERAKYQKSLKNGELKLKDILDDALAENHPHQRLLIVVDQFEELYTLCSSETQNLFIDNLLELINLNKENPDVVIVITLRADFYRFVLDYQPLAEILQKWKPEALTKMTREELESVIEKPAEVVGLKIQDGLTKIILDDVTNNPGQLPLLEFALKNLYEHQSNHQLTIAAYYQIGGIRKALANYAESIYEEFNKKEQQQIKHIFTQLVRFGEQTESTRRLATYEQIGASNWELVPQLADNRLVVTGHNIQINQRTVEVVHEALIRGWERLQQWIAEDRDFRKWQDRLRFAMKTWEEQNRDNSALLRGALLVEAGYWLKQKSESITDKKEIKFIENSRQFQKQEDIERIQDLLNLSDIELQVKQHLSSLVKAVKAGIKFRSIQEPSEGLKINIIARLQQGIYEIKERNQLVGHTRAINDVAFNSDGSMIAAVGDDWTVKVWELEGNLLRSCEGHNEEVYGISFSPDGQIFASGSFDGTVRLWTVEGTLLRILGENTNRVYGVSFRPDGQVLASASADGTVQLWTINGTLLHTLEGHAEPVFRVSFSPDSQILASASYDKTVRLWTMEGTLLRTLEGHTDRVLEVSFSPDGQILASASYDKTVRLWTIDGKLLHTLEGHTDRVLGVSFSPDGQTLASASYDKTVRLWTMEGTLLRTLEGHTDLVWGVSFSPDGQTLASASADKTLRLWTVERTLLHTLEGHTQSVFRVSFSPDGQTLASVGYDRTVRLWTIKGTLLHTLKGHTAQVYGVSFSPDGKILASASYDKTVRLWTVEGTLLRTLEGHAELILGVSFSPDGQVLASASADKTVRLWTVEGTLLRALEGHMAEVYEVSFSPDGQVLASASADKTVRLWTVEGTLLRTLEGHTDRVYGVSFSPDGKILASASYDGTVRLWIVEGTPLRILEGHMDRVLEVSFHPDSQILASVSYDKMVRLWTIEGKLLRTFEGHTDIVWGVSFSPDGRILASASADGTVKLWPIYPEDLIVDLDVKLSNFLKKGCNWVKDYLKTNPNVSENDRNLCDDYF